MVSSFPPQSFTIDSSAALQELGEFLYETNKSIERILHRYTLNPPPRKNEIFSDVSVRANSPNSSSSPPPPTVTRSLLPNIGLAMLEHRSTTLNKEDMAQEGSFRDGCSSILRNFMEEILKTSSDWCAKHKLILEGKDLSYMVKSTNPEEHFRMCLNQDRNTEIGVNPKDEIEGSVKAHLNNSSSPLVHDADKCIVNPLCRGGKDEEKTARLSSSTLNQPDANGSNEETSFCSIPNTVNSNKGILIDEVNVEQENQEAINNTCNSLFNV